ncbi:hypothetical protein ACQEU5_10045 [Marinactinospora thermotolerans]|uniref:LysM domain-containing protein n=1 Tax=Marinactinospora thermotolerans DSM 45154 TaxID=1122192 RepID=A0A1T4N5W2_9ACTN|nr:hypothetical protein [Marinactinospora thermotolerans]SJZ74531.1 hypothetical protein SAMN02745673_01287 [Marinactinospora thermotolerans DSM 45154]
MLVCAERLRRGGVLLALGGVVALATPGAALAAPVDPSATSLDAAIAQCPTVKYYTVPDGSVGLFQVAAEQLDESLRAQEIYELNEGRQQPDGGALGAERTLAAGWKLILPDDASGPGVTEGTDPLCVAEAEREAAAAAAAAAQSPSPSPSVSPSPSASPSAQPSPSVSASPAAAQADDEGSGLDPKLLAAGAGVLVLLTVLALWWRPIFRTLWWPFKKLGSLNWPRPRLPEFLRVRIARKRRAEVTDLMLQDKGARVRAGTAVIEVQSAPAAVPARPLAVLAGRGDDLRLVVPADCTPPAGAWRAGTGEEATLWQRAAGRSSSAVSFATASQVIVRPAQAMLVALGMEEDRQVFVDFSRASGPVAIAGHRATAAEAVTVIAQGLRGIGCTVTWATPDRPLDRLLPERPEVSEGVRRVTSNAMWGPDAPSELREVIAVARPLTPAERDALADAPPGTLVVVTGESVYAHWQWRVDETGVLDTGAIGPRPLLRLPDPQ